MSNLYTKYNVGAVTGYNTVLSSEMLTAIDLWNDIATHNPTNADWYNDVEPSGVTEALAGALSDPVAEEVDVSAPNNELLDKVLRQLNEKSTELVNNLSLLGASLIRPIFANGKIQFEIVKLGNYIPLSYDFDGTLTGALVLKKLDAEKKHYLLIEVHKYENLRHNVKMELYEIQGEAGSLKRRNLADCPQTEGLTESYTWGDDEHPIERPMIIEIRNRKPNNIDGSLCPVPFYSGNENLIKDADEQYARMNWEQESAKRLVFADEDLFNKKKDENNKLKLGERLRKMFVKVQGNGLAQEKIETFSPEIRTTGQVEAFQQILRRLELACNIGKGTLSDLEAVQQTATQYTGGKKALYTVIDSIESELEEKYQHCAYVFAYMISAFIPEVPFDDEITVTFNDTLRKDPQQMKLEALNEINAGIMSPWEYRAMFYGEDEETARANTPEKVTDNYTLGL